MHFFPDASLSDQCGQVPHEGLPAGEVSYSGRLVSGGDEGTNPVSSEMSKSRKRSSVLISSRVESRPLAPRDPSSPDQNDTGVV